MRGFIVSAITLTSLLVGSAAFAAQSSGTVGSYDRLDRSFWINGEKYQLPAASRKSLSNGDKVSVQWDQSGDVRMVTLFTVDQLRSDD